MSDGIKVGDTVTVRFSSGHSFEERGMIFSGPMVRALLAGTKSQTRRLIRVPRDVVSYWRAFKRPQGLRYAFRTKTSSMEVACPHGIAGDRLWVRETWHKDTDGVSYRADRLCSDALVKWKPSIYMPRWASRITLEITKVRVERLQDITIEDVKAEGIEASVLTMTTSTTGKQTTSKSDGGLLNIWGYEFLWNKLHGIGAWEKNPWVWVLDFRTI